MILRKGLMGATAVLLVLASAVLSVETWAAKEAEGTSAYRGIRQVRFLPVRPPSKEAERELAERIAEYLGMSGDEVEALMDGGVERGDLIPAAAIAKLSNRDLQTVLKAKTERKTWHSVAEGLGVDAGEFRREVRQLLPAGKGKAVWLEHDPEVVLKSIAEYLAMDEKKLAEMINKEKVRPREWLKAAVLSKLSGKPLSNVIAMKKKGSWLEVANTLGVSREEVRTEMHRLKRIVRKHAKRRNEEYGEAGGGEVRPERDGKRMKES